MLAPMRRQLGRLAEAIESFIPFDLFDVPLPGDEPDGWISARTEE